VRGVDIKALTLWQPYATLIALGHKRVETRSWPTKYRGPIAIHASKRRLAESELALIAAIADLFGISLKAGELPLGKVVATATLADCRLMTREMIFDQSDLELDLGHWATNRFAWVLEDVKPLARPLPARGSQGLWDWRVPL
jgi:hypothetical protein